MTRRRDMGGAHFRRASFQSATMLFLLGALLAAWGQPVTAALPADDAVPPPYPRPVKSFMVPDFPPGLTWFNVAHPLTMRGLRGKLVLLDFWTYG